VLCEVSNDLNSDNQGDNSGKNKQCSVCGSKTSYKEKTKWGVYEYWYGSKENPICGRCYARAKWKQKFIHVEVKCDNCGSIKTTLSKYGTPMWVKNRDSENGYLCWSCYITKRNTGIVFSQERRANVKAGIARAIDAGKVFGRKLHTINEAAFDTITEESTYWVGFLMADGSLFKQKTGNPRIALTLKEADYEHLVKFSKFLTCSYKILRKPTKLHGKIILQYTLRFSSKHIAEVLTGFGVVARKSLIVKVIGLENDKNFWRGVVDGDGWIGPRNGMDGDKITLTGSYDLLSQFKMFIEKSVPESIVKIKQQGRYCRLYIYSYTARAVAELLYDGCSIALERKLSKAKKMFD
jgi:hypothetical protein